ncbi:MAG: hypothetical protein ACK2UW_13355 [Anaerolineales bacterium]
MQILNFLAGLIILAFCVFLIGLAALIVFRPRRAEQFLSTYASSARAHYTEQAGRLLVGAAFLVLAPAMELAQLMSLFGWILVVTTIGLLLIPWTWHHKFGELVIPKVLRYMQIYALGSFVLGVFFLYCLSGVLK